MSTFTHLSLDVDTTTLTQHVTKVTELVNQLKIICRVLHENPQSSWHSHPHLNTLRAVIDTSIYLHLPTCLLHNSYIQLLLIFPGTRGYFNVSDFIKKIKERLKINLIIFKSQYTSELC